jgi:hypothetical protein
VINGSTTWSNASAKGLGGKLGLARLSRALAQPAAAAPGYEPGVAPQWLTAPIQRFQSGVVKDYVTWIVFGLAWLRGALALVVR